jgi:hypothetical protein
MEVGMVPENPTYAWLHKNGRVQGDLAWCSYKKHWASVYDFSSCNRLKYKISGRCRTCSNSASQAAASKPHIQSRREAYTKKPEVLERRRTHWQSAKGKIASRAYELKGHYDISLEDYDSQFSKQNGLCALCSDPLPIDRQAAIDHDHACTHSARVKLNKFHNGCRECIRGLLCDDCNLKMLPVLENHPHLQTECVKNYLNQRPFAGTKAHYKSLRPPYKNAKQNNEPSKMCEL